MSLYASMASVVASAHAQVVTIVGDTTVSYQIANRSGSNDYGEPVVTYSASTVTAFIQPLGDKEASLIEPGFLRQHYVKAHFVQDGLTPTTLDRFTWEGISFEMRSVIPCKMDNQVVWYDVLARRISV